MSDTQKHCYPTILSIKEWQNKIENFSGFDCIHLRELKSDSTIEDYYSAKEKDSLWFEGFVNDLENLI